MKEREQGIQEALRELEQLRDTLRLEGHLAKADLRDLWHRAKAEWPRLETRLAQETEDTRKLLGEKAARLLAEIEESYHRLEGRH